jgi:hypothetical protein
MMKIINKIILLTFGLFLAGCEETITVDLKTEAPRLVIDASIDWVKNTTGNEQKIKLSTTTDYYSPTFPTVSGGTVTVTNSANTIFNFIETSGTGEYICTNFVPVIGETYTMTITLNGETYTATETLINVPNIENNIVQNNAGGFAGDEIEITYYYQDNVAQENYYLFGIKTSHIAFPIFDAENDENTQGNLMSEQYSHKDLVAGDIINIKLYGISERYYSYFKKILLAAGSDNPFASTPAPVRGNIVNQTDSKNFAFGYFRLSEVDTKNYTIQ